MCKFGVSQESIIEFLKKNSWYRNDVVLGISKQYSAKDITCFLLERSRDFSEAFSLHLEMLVGDMASCRQKAVDSRISKILEFLQRNSRSMTTEQTHKLWFELLDVVLCKQQELKGKSPSKSNEDELTAQWMRQTTSRIMTTGTPYLPPGLILQKIVSSPAYSNGRFSELRGLVTNMMETCSYEQVLMKTCAKMVEDDLVHHMSSLRKNATKAISSGHNNPCSLCSREMFHSFVSSNAETEEIISFHCGHSYHLACVTALTQQQSRQDGQFLKCHTCHKSKMTLHGSVLLSKPTSVTSFVNDVDQGVQGRDTFTKKFFQMHKTLPCLSLLSSLNDNAVLSKHRKKNIFQSEEWLNQRLAAPPVTKL